MNEEMMDIYNSAFNAEIDKLCERGYATEFSTSYLTALTYCLISERRNADEQGYDD